jgi:hypothetical protein
MSDEGLSKLLSDCVVAVGADRVREHLNEMLQYTAPTDTLTIIANAGVHSIPTEFLRGDVYAASHGNWSISSREQLEADFKRILVLLARKLKQSTWKQIYFIPTGHPGLSIQIKLLVYRVTRINTIDLFFADGKYYEIQLNHRDISLGSGDEETT